MNLPSESNHKIETESLQIRHLPFSSKQSVAWLSSLSAITFICLTIVSLGHFILPIPIVYLLFALSIFSFLLIVCGSYLLIRPGNRFSIELSKDKLSFPVSFAPDLLFRQTRNWSDIANILLGSMLLQDKDSVYEYDLEQSKNNRKIFIYFKSGGHAAIDLNKLNKDDSEKLFLAIESWCLDYSRSPLTKKPEDEDTATQKRKKELEEEAIPRSYTELWEKELQDHFSSTNFVPLKKGDHVQDGKLRVLMPLSSGGLSAVYLVENRDKELRILKEAVIPSNQKLMEKTRAMFKREALILQKINHPNIASVHDYFVDRGRDYLLLDFIAGNTLRQQLAQYGPIEEEVALDYTLDIICLISYLHDMNPPIIHRDISPDNLVVREDGSVVLIDFGAANELISTATGTLVGKQAYMAPEQFRGKAVKESDLYGIGATLYFLLTGTDPKPLTESHPRETNKKTTPLTDALVAGLTKQSVEDRFSSLTEVHDKIDQIIKHGGGAVIDTSGSN